MLRVLALACLASSAPAAGAEAVGMGGLGVELVEGVAVLAALALWLRSVWLRRRIEHSERRLRAAAAEATAAEARWRAVVENAPDMILLIGADRRIAYVSRTLPGVRREDVVGRDVLEFASPDRRDALVAGFARLLAEGVPFVYEDAGAGVPPGSWFEVRCGPIDGPEGRRALMVVTDCSARRRAEAAQREGAARYRQLVEQSPEAIWIHDERILFANSAAARLFGAAGPEDFVGRVMMDLVHPSHHDAVRERCETTVRTRRTNPFAQRLCMRIDGTPITIETTSAAIELPDGRTAVQVVARDQSHRLAAERELRESEARFRAVFDVTLQAVGVSHAGLHVLANRAYLDLFGYATEADLRGKPITELLDESEHARIRDYVGRRLRGEDVPSVYETIGRRSDGSTFAMEARISSYRQGDQVMTVAAMRDVSGRRKEAETRARAALEREHLVGGAQLQLERLALPCVVMDHGFSVSGWNRAAERLFGWTRDEAIGRPALELLVPPAARPHVQALFERLAAGEMAIGDEGSSVAKDGSAVECRWLNTAIHASDGSLIGFMAIAWDVGEQRRLEERLRHSQKMEAVGQLAGGIAHDFNNLLTVIGGYGQMLLESRSLAVAERRSAEQVLKAASRAAALTRQLLAFSRRQVLQPKVLDLNAVVGDMEKLLRPLIGEDIAVVLSLSPALGRVRADPGQFEQVLMNLAVNARDAMPGGGTLSIETANVAFESAAGARGRELEPGHWVMLAVRDTGCGMDQATLGHLFEPFFTTKEPGRGTGLGLATVYGIVKQSGGNILVYSEPGRGTSFEIYLPRIDEDGERAPGVAEGGESARGDETVLLVEDDRDVLDLARSSLERGGFRVIAANDGPQALELAQAHAGEIHLALCDVIMPGMSGREVVDRLRHSRPGLRAVYMSGYADKAIVHKGILSPGVVLVTKPFSAHALLRKVRETLDADPGTAPPRDRN